MTRQERVIDLLTQSIINGYHNGLIGLGSVPQCIVDRLQGGI